MSKSIIQRDWNRCYLCHCRDQKLDVHHVFFGPGLRPKSEEYGLTVHLCHERCHIFGENSVHKNRQVDLMLKRRVQKIAMLKYNWSLSEWRQEFYKSYLTEEDYKDVT